jgi:hypothetical protein
MPIGRGSFTGRFEALLRRCQPLVRAGAPGRFVPTRAISPRRGICPPTWRPVAAANLRFSASAFSGTALAVPEMHELSSTPSEIPDHPYLF